MSDDDMTTPNGLRIVRDSDHARILHSLEKTTMVLERIRSVQTEQGATLDSLAANAKDTATATIKIATLNEAREAREIRKEEREDARSDQRWAWWSDNWRWFALGACALLAPEVVPRLVAAWGL